MKKPDDSTTDSNLARGMDIALTLLVFVVLGWLLDRWLGLFPVVTIGLTLFAAIGTFVRMKYTYDATMERLEAERRAARTAANAGPMKGAA
jgi:F0F1-type ATP synthase assembly protein I